MTSSGWTVPGRDPAFASQAAHIVVSGTPAGSGFFLSHDLVLTTAHILPTSGEIEVQTANRRRIAATIVWANPELDAALLRVEVTELARSRARHGWRSSVPGEWVQATGFPRTSGESRQSSAVRIWGRTVEYPSRPDRMALDMEHSVSVRQGTSWVGMSGAVVLGLRNEILGMLVEGGSDGGKERLFALPVGFLTDDSDFMALAAAHLDSVPSPTVTAGTPLEALLSPPFRSRPMGIAEADFLDARTGGVPFVDRQSEIAELINWCESTRPTIDVAVVVGAAGTGKTRLAAELCQTMSARGWEAGFVDSLAGQWDEPIFINGPTLIVIDYADFAPVHRLLDLLGSANPGSIRLLLLVRQLESLADIPRIAGPRVSLDEQPMGLAQLTRLAEAAIAAADYHTGSHGEALVDRSALNLQATATPLDVLLAVTLLRTAPGTSRDPRTIRRAVGETLMERWLSHYPAPDKSGLAAEAFILAILLKPGQQDMAVLLRAHFGSEMTNPNQVPRLANWLGTVFGATDDFVAPPDLIISSVLQSIEGRERVIRTSMEWASSRPPEAVRLLRLLTGAASEETSLLDAVVKSLNEYIERYAELAAASDDVLAALSHCITGLVGTGKDKIPARRWQATIRVARGVGPINFAGLADRSARVDKLGRAAFIDTLVDMIRTVPDTSADDDDTRGPSVVAIDGPWGAGKTSLMRIVQDKLDEVVGDPGGTSSRGRLRSWASDRWAARRLTVAAAIWQLWRWREGAEEKHSGTLEPNLITVWFNPWAHQSSEQLWAGLARAIIDAVNSRLHRHGNERARYWLNQNARRLDRPQLRRTLFRSAQSPIMRVAFFALFPAVAAALVRYDKNFHLFGRDRPATLVALVLTLLVLAVGLVHTLSRLLFGRAETYAPAGLLDAPVLSGSLAGAATETGLRDPLYHARSGYLYLVQHDIERLLCDAAKRNMTVVVFVDDLDRCNPKTTAEMLEAVNLFLSESFPAARFVLGLDMSVVASHIDQTLKDFANLNLNRHSGDPTQGWTFLRKLVQLPVTLPRISPAVLDTLVDGILGEADADMDESSPPWATSTAPAASVTRSDIAAAPTVPRPQAAVRLEATSDAEAAKEVEEGKAVVAKKVAQLERNPEIRECLRDRLRTIKQPSARETKRLLTVWQFYVRVLSHGGSLTGAAEVRRARATLLLAEVVVRWPALLPTLVAVTDGRRGLTRLSEAAHFDDLAWARLLVKTGLDPSKNQDACNELREILRSEDGPIVAELAELLF